MAQWMGKLGFELEIMADYIFGEVKKAERVFADETTLPTLAPGSGSTKTAYLWAYAQDDRTFGRSGPPMVAYRFEDSRSGECAVRHLNGYRGILQVDGYAAYNKLARSDRGNEGVTLAGCWSHCRRKFYELHVAGSSEVATATVEQMARLWQVEKTVRRQSPTLALPRASRPPRRSSQISSTPGSGPCGGSPANQSSLRRSAMPSRAVPSSNAS
ncbi:Transposase IS66 family protein [Bradyrhizobium sp. Gha]|nr:Transposase IS66 family protein [Bradyrhizobium sp. Gha]